MFLLGHAYNSARITQLEIRHTLSLGRAGSGEDTQARSFKEVVATWQFIARA